MSERMYDQTARGATIAGDGAPEIRRKGRAGWFARRRDLWEQPTVAPLAKGIGRLFVDAVGDLAVYQPAGVEREVAGRVMIVPQGGITETVEGMARAATITDKQARSCLGKAIKSGL